MKVQKQVKEATNELTPTEFFFELSKVDDNKYLLVSKLALALLTAHNSSNFKTDNQKVFEYFFL